MGGLKNESIARTTDGIKPPQKIRRKDGNSVARNVITELRIIKLEKKHPEMLFLDSEADGLYYAASAGDQRIAILGNGGTIILNRAQMYALCREGMEVFNAYAGRGNRRTLAVAIKENKQKSEEEK